MSIHTKIRIGILGCANIAERSMIPAILSLPEEFELVAVASRSLDKAEAMANKFNCEAIVGYDEMIGRSDIDALYIPLPTGLHKEWITNALLSKKHCYVEKAFAINAKDADEMVYMARQSNISLMEGYMFQYHNQHRLVLDILNSGKIGELRGFSSYFGFPPLSKDNFRYDMSLGGGVLTDAAGYPLRAAYLILGERLEVKAATLHKNEDNTELYGSAFLSNGEGIGVHIGFGFDNFYQCKYELWGSIGKIIVEKAFTPKPDFSPTIIVETAMGREGIVAPPDDHFRNAMKEFHKSIHIGSVRDRLYAEILIQSRSLDLIRKYAENKSNGN